MEPSVTDSPISGSVTLTVASGMSFILSLSSSRAYDLAETSGKQVDVIPAKTGSGARRAEHQPAVSTTRRAIVAIAWTTDAIDNVRLQRRIEEG